MICQSYKYLYDPILLATTISILTVPNIMLNNLLQYIILNQIGSTKQKYLGAAAYPSPHTTVYLILNN